MVRIEFIDSGDPGAQRMAKVYAARYTSRRKRLRDVAQFERSLEGQEGESSRTRSPEELATEELESGSESLVLSVAMQDDVFNDDIGYVSQDLCPQTQQVSNSECNREIDNPRISQALEWSRNTFSRLDQVDQKLLRWYLGSLPHHAWDVAEQARANPVREALWPCVMNSTTNLEATVLFISGFLAFWERCVPSQRLLEQKGRLIHLVNKNMKDPIRSLSDDMVFILCNVILPENRIGDPLVCQIHLHGLMEIIRLKGGIESMDKNWGLMWMYSWMEITLTKPPFQPHLGRYAAMRLGNSRQHHMREMLRENGRFYHFLLHLQQQMDPHLRKDTTNDREKGDRQHLLFKKDSPYYVMLAPEDRSTTVGQISNNCRLASLLYITFVLNEYVESPGLATAFLRQLSILLVNHNLDTNPRPKLLIYVLYRDVETENVPARFRWLVGAMRVLRRLSHETCETLQKVLLNGLGCGELDRRHLWIDLELLLRRVKGELA